MKKFYNNFLTEYKGLQSEVSDTISEEINLNLKGGENSLFPNFIKVSSSLKSTRIKDFCVEVGTADVVQAVTTFIPDIF